MSLTIIITAAALYLAMAPAFITAPAFASKLFYKAIPMVLAVLLGSVAFGRFMGWPL